MQGQEKGMVRVGVTSPACPPHPADTAKEGGGLGAPGGIPMPCGAGGWGREQGVGGRYRVSSPLPTQLVGPIREIKPQDGAH